MLPDDRSAVRDEGLRAQRPEDVVGGRKVRFGIVHDASHRCEQASLRVDGLRRASVEWDAAEIDPPRDARTREVSLERWWLPARHGSEEQRDIFRGPRHRTVDA